MNNRWHADQDNNMRPDVIAKPCPWCGYDHGVVVDTEMHEGEHLNTWTAQASCHECGATSPNIDIGPFPHPLKDDCDQIDWDNEREVVNFALKVWNCRVGH